MQSNKDEVIKVFTKDDELREYRLATDEERQKTFVEMIKQQITTPAIIFQNPNQYKCLLIGNWKYADGQHDDIPYVKDNLDNMYRLFKHHSVMHASNIDYSLDSTHE